MKITATRREDILRQREEYDRKAAAQQAALSEQVDSWQQDTRAMLTGLEDTVRAELAQFPLDIEVDADRDYVSKFARIRITCNERRKFDDDIALSWNYTIRIKNDQVTRESGSWSGLQATTPKQIADLKASVAAIEHIMNMDWESIIRKDLPKYDEYVTEERPDARNRPNFESQLLMEDISDVLNKNVLLKGQYQGRKGWWGFVKETAKTYSAYFVADYYTGEDIAETAELVKKWSIQRVKKDDITNLVTYPVEKLEY